MKIKAGLEGAVKFNQNIINLQARMPDITELNAWRDILYGAELIGQNIVDGKEVGYGNVSQLLRPYNAGNNNKRFVITGTQTGKYSRLFKENYSIVLGYYPETNSVDIQEGTADASSESMTHGTLYDIDEKHLEVIHNFSKKVAVAFKKVYKSDGTSVRQHNEPAGNQDVWHYHLHVFPRYENDRLYQNHEKTKWPTKEERIPYSDKLKTYFKKL